MKWKNCLGSLGLHYKWVLLFLYLNFFFSFDVCGSVHHSTIHKEKSSKMQMYQNFIIPYLYEAQHVLGDTPPTIRSPKLHWQFLVFCAWKVVGCVVGGRCQAYCA
jgi:hypothetical protein